MMDVSTARADFSAALELSRGGAVVLEQDGRPAAVLLSPERYDQLMAVLDETDDIRAFDAATDEAGPDVEWAQVASDLGRT